MSSADFSNPNYNPPTHYDMAELTARLKESVAIVDRVNKALGKKMTTVANGNIASVQSVLSHIVNETVKPYAASQLAVGTVLQNVAARIDGNMSAAMTHAALAVDPTLSMQPRFSENQPGIGCTGNEPDPYVDWCSEVNDEIWMPVCGFYGSGDCPDGYDAVLIHNDQGQFTQCRKLVKRPSGFDRGRDCKTGTYNPPSPTSGGPLPVTPPGGGGSPPTSPPTNGGPIPVNPPIGGGPVPTYPPVGGGSGPQPSPTCPAPTPPCPPPGITVLPAPVYVYPSGGGPYPTGGEGTTPTPTTPDPTKPYCPDKPKVCKKPPDYYGFCNFATGDTAVDTVGTDFVLAGYTFVALGTDRDAVQQVTDDICKSGEYDDRKKRKKPPPIDISGVTKLTGLSTLCDLSLYRDPNQLLNVLPPLKAELAVAVTQSEAIAGYSSVFDQLAAIPGLGPIGAAIGAAVIGKPKMIAEIAPLIHNIIDCKPGQLTGALEYLGLFHYYGELIGVDLQAVSRPLGYVLEATCRTKHMSADQANACFLANTIDYSDWDVLQAIDGICPDDSAANIKAQRAKPVPIELAIQRRRAIIDDSQYYDGMRQLGFIEPVIVDRLFSITEQRPGAAELIRFMVRDADDLDIVEHLGLDDLFEHKYGTKLKQWAADQGITDEQMRYNWRSHWTIPGPQQLFEFWQRLRRNAKFGTPAEQRAKIEKALIHNDILPTWFDSFFAVQYNPLGRIDLRRMFNTGTIDKQELDDGYAAIGYDDENCKRLVKFTARLKVQQAKSLPFIKQWQTFAITGDELRDRLAEYKFSDDEITQLMQENEYAFQHSDYARAYSAGSIDALALRHYLSDQGVSDNGIDDMLERLALLIKNLPPVDDYDAGIITRDDATKQLQQFGLSEDHAAQLLNKVDLRLSKSLVKVCVSGIRKRFMSGDLDNEQASSALIGQGLTLERANVLVAGWNCMSSAKGKQIAASQLCSWYSDGIINDVDMMKRLATLGYEQNDAINIVASCNIKIDKAMQKDAAAQLKAQQAAIEKAKSQSDKESARLLRNAVSIKKAAEAAKKAKLNREAQLLGAANKLEKKGDITIQEAIAAVHDIKDTLINQFALGLDEVLKLMLSTAESWTGGDVERWRERVLANAELLIAEQLSASSDSLVNSASVNGVQ